ncbi:MAG TPA: LuxR C-terminal-related transcriptional regulator [Solirubrobacterales bacterium]|nr:LuxR C-terminal-related transcriptional regulator [Solirubrobacterales bacterium]
MTRVAGQARLTSYREPIDHRDAIRGNDPLAQTAGLALDFVTKMVSAPMALFLAADHAGQYDLAAIKADPILTTDPDGLARQYLDCVEESDPILAISGACGRTRLMNTENLGNEPEFTDSALARVFLRRHELGHLMVLFMRDGASGKRCLLILLRSTEEHEFSDREQGFLRHVAPLLTQSYHCAIDTSAVADSPVARDAHLTPREVEIARLAASGSHNDEIAAALNIAPGTVKCHIRNIYSKLDVDSRLSLALALSALAPMG